MVSGRPSNREGIFKPLLFATGSDGRERRLTEFPAEGVLDALLPTPAGSPWEVEIGFGKGRYLLDRARAEPQARFLGVEIASEYWRLLANRARHWQTANLVAVRGDARYLMSAILPQAFARRVHVYFPDPWPKARHQKRRIFDPESVDLVLGAVEPGGELLFATDFLEYGELVAEILCGHPGVEVTRVEEPWPEGPRTNYEAKYMIEGRPIVRLIAKRIAQDPVHPEGRLGLLVAVEGATPPSVTVQ